MKGDQPVLTNFLHMTYKMSIMCGREAKFGTCDQTNKLSRRIAMVKVYMMHIKIPVRYTYFIIIEDMLSSLCMSNTIGKFGRVQRQYTGAR